MAIGTAVTPSCPSGFGTITTVSSDAWRIIMYAVATPIQYRGAGKAFPAYGITLMPPEIQRELYSVYHNLQISVISINKMKPQLVYYPYRIGSPPSDGNNLLISLLLYILMYGEIRKRCCQSLGSGFCATLIHRLERKNKNYHDPQKA